MQSLEADLRSFTTALDQVDDGSLNSLMERARRQGKETSSLLAAVKTEASAATPPRRNGSLRHTSPAVESTPEKNVSFSSSTSFQKRRSYNRTSGITSNSPHEERASDGRSYASPLPSSAPKFVSSISPIDRVEKRSDEFLRRPLDIDNNTAEQEVTDADRKWRSLVFTLQEKIEKQEVLIDQLRDENNHLKSQIESPSEREVRRASRYSTMEETRTYRSIDFLDALSTELKSKDPTFQLHLSEFLDEHWEQLEALRSRRERSWF